MAIENDSQDVETEAEASDDVIETEDETTEDTTEVTKEEKPKETPQQKEARLERQLSKVRKELGKDVERKAPESRKQEKDGLDDNALDFLDLKGVSEAEDIALIEKIVAKTGQTVREALKDEYVVAKLEANKKAREVKDATPSGTKRATATTDSLEQAIATFERTKELPKDFALASKVVNALAERSSSNKPAWK